MDNMNALFDAAKNGDLDRVKHLIDDVKVDANARDWV